MADGGEEGGGEEGGGEGSEGFTVTVHELVKPPAVTVIVTEPLFTAVTLPAPSTAAIFESLLEKAGAGLFVASAGKNVTDTTPVPPMFKLREEVTEIPVNGIFAGGGGVESGAVTVIVQVFTTLPTVMLIFAVPEATPVTTPFASTVATVVLSDTKEAAGLFVAFSGT